jgi:hypothetical protein
MAKLTTNSHPKSHLFMGRKYRILHRAPKNKAWSGSCDDPKAKNRAIEIDPKLSGIERLRIMIDESIHATFWDLDNDSVAGAAFDIARFLWRSGLRFRRDE